VPTTRGKSINIGRHLKTSSLQSAKASAEQNIV